MVASRYCLPTAGALTATLRLAPLVWVLAALLTAAGGGDWRAHSFHFTANASRRTSSGAM